ncbi:MAG: glycosyltransferase family 2 protein [Bacteroidetes bacterium]|nr:glycosyltransferase family 2 protein [Bacteroidota bacterium]
MDEEILESLDISIIIVNFKSFEITKDTIESLKKFSEGFSYEVIVVDNASRDGSAEKLMVEFPDCKFILNDENRGFGPANNQGLQTATGEFILFLNNDIIFVENTLQILLQYLSEQKGRILIAPKLLNKDGSVQHSVYSFQTLWLSFTTYSFLFRIFPRSKYFNRHYLMHRGINEITEVETITGAFMLFKREDVLELDGFDEDYFFYGEDNDLCKRFRDSEGKIIYYPETKIIHLKGGTLKTGWFHQKHHTLSVLNLFKKHYSFPKRVLAHILFFAGNLVRGILLLIAWLFTFKTRYFRETLSKFRTLLLITKIAK